MVEKIHFERSSLGCLFQITNVKGVTVDPKEVCSHLCGMRDPLGEISNKIAVTRRPKGAKVNA